MYAQCVHIKATNIVAIIPTRRPAFLKATGIANIPVPREAFNKCVNVSQSLNIRKEKNRSLEYFQIIYHIKQKSINFNMILRCRIVNFAFSERIKRFSFFNIFWCDLYFISKSMK